MSQLVFAPRYWLTTLVLGRAVSGEAVGYFSVAYSLCRYLSLVSTSLALPYVPLVSRLASQDPEALGELVPKVQRAVAALLLPAAFALALAAPYLLVLLFGEAFRPAWPVLVGLACAFYLAGLIDNLGQMLLGLARTWAGFWMNLAATAVFALILWAAAPGWGPLGAALAYAATFAVHGAMKAAYASRALGIHLHGHAPAFAAALLFAAAGGLHAWGPSSSGVLGAGGLLAAAAALWSWRLLKGSRGPLGEVH